MIESARSLVKLIDERSGHTAYEWIGFFAAVLTLVAVAHQTTPTQAVAGALRRLEMTSLAEWFTSGIPRVLVEPHPHAHLILVLTATGVCIMMALAPYRLARENETSLAFQHLALAGAPAASTTHVLLLLATQFGSLAWIAPWVIRTAVAAYILLPLCYLVGWILHRGGRSRWNESIQAVGETLRTAAVHSTKMLLTPLYALLFAAIAPVISTFSSLCSMESRASLEARRHTTCDTRELPTGAITEVSTRTAR